MGRTTIILLVCVCLTSTHLLCHANVPHSSEDLLLNTLPTVPANSGLDPTSSDASINELLLSGGNWRPKPPFESPVHDLNLSSSASSSSSHSTGHESKEGMRYAVASFDFNHVATPYIISLWIIIVGLAKIGE
jgi:hypothetical protein